MALGGEEQPSAAGGAGSRRGGRRRSRSEAYREKIGLDGSDVQNCLSGRL